MESKHKCQNSVIEELIHEISDIKLPVKDAMVNSIKCRIQPLLDKIANIKSNNGQNFRINTFRKLLLSCVINMAGNGMNPAEAKQDVLNSLNGLIESCCTAKSCDQS